MHLTGDERVKTTSAITQLEQKIKTLENELKELENLHVSLGKQHGSELCAGEMVSNENKLHSKIEEKRGLIFSLERILIGTFDVSHERVTELKKELEDRRRKIENAQTYLKTLKHLLAHIREVREITGIA